MSISQPQINAEQASIANEIVRNSPANATCATALAAERSDGRWNLYVYDPDPREGSEPWLRITPDPLRCRSLAKPDAGAVWAGIEGQYIGEGEPIVEQVATLDERTGEARVYGMTMREMYGDSEVSEMECAALNTHEGVRSVRGHGINE